MHAVGRIDNRQAERINYWFLLVEEEGVSRYEENAEEKDYRCTDSRNEDKNESSLVFTRLSRAFKMSSSPAWEQLSNVGICRYQQGIRSQYPQCYFMGHGSIPWGYCSPDATSARIVW